MINKKLVICFLLILGLTSCYQISSSDTTYREVPVTNNPNIIPSHSSGIGLPY